MLTLLALVCLVVPVLMGLVSVSINSNVSIDGVTGNVQVTDTGETARKANQTVLVGQAGTLTTRTNGTDGSLTLATGHGFITGGRLDLYWTNADGTDGKAYGATIGTVAGLVVPFTGLTGDALPAAAYSIVAGKPNDAAVSWVGDNMKGLLLASQSSSGYMVISDGSGDLFAAYVTPTTPYVWYYSSGITNPIAGDTPTKVWMSQKGTTSAATDMNAVAAVA